MHLHMVVHDLMPESKICLIRKPVGVMANMPCSFNAGGTAHNVAEEKRHYGSCYHDIYHEKSDNSLYMLQRAA